MMLHRASVVGSRGGRTCRPAEVRFAKWRQLVLASSILACASVAMLVGACATANPTAGPRAEDDVRIPDGAVEAGAADAGDADAAPCTDCEYFTETCTADVLCAGGPFEPSTPGGGFDVRTQINVIRGRSASDVWIAGALGALAHFDGTSWSRSDLGTQEDIRAFWLRDSGEIALSKLEYLFSRGLAPPDAGASPGGWTRDWPESFPPDYDGMATAFESAWGTPGAEWLWTASRMKAGAFAFMSGLSRLRRLPSGEFEVADGIAWSDFTGQMTAIHGASPDVLWAVGLEGVTARITGAQSDTPSIEVFNSQTWNALHGVWVASDSEAWSVGAEGTIRHYAGDSTSWDVVPDVTTKQPLRAVWGSSTSDVWVVGDGAIVLHYDGTRWLRMKIAGLGARRPDLTTVWTAGPGHVWIGGQGVVLSLGGKP